MWIFFMQILMELRRNRKCLIWPGICFFGNLRWWKLVAHQLNVWNIWSSRAFHRFSIDNFNSNTTINILNICGICLANKRRDVFSVYCQQSLESSLERWKFPQSLLNHHLFIWLFFRKKAAILLFAYIVATRVKCLFLS